MIAESIIGKPIANTQIYIVDKHMNPMPIGVTGELCIAGDGVGAGYLKRPELTAEKFIDNPFGEGKLYKTGDLAYWREDGNIVYVGRNDFQVKIRGLRIELGEIESAIISVKGINQSVVVVRKNAEERQIICAFYTGKDTDPHLIKQHISSKLPKYMIPHIFKHLNEMPLTASGKINRKALPEVDLEDISANTEYIAPTNEKEKILCSVMANVLKVERVGITDDFFDLGGDSLKAIEYVSKARSHDLDISLQKVFDYPTVKEQCELDTKQSNNEQIDLSDSDVQRYSKLLSRNTMDNMSIANNDLGNVFLTGATGFLGAHILDSLLRNTDGMIYCLVRSNRQDDRRGRLSNTLNWYFGDKYDNELGKRIIPIIGNIENKDLASNLPTDVKTVIHAAATVKHFGTYEYFNRVNVEGTRNVAEYAGRIHAKMIHISTISVSGNAMADEGSVYRSSEALEFAERNFYIGQPLHNVYIRSKFEAERVIFDMIMADNLNAIVIRVGNLTNRASDLKFQPNFESNAFLKRMKAILELGLFPDYLISLYSEFSPVDLTADGIVKIARHVSNQNVFHLYSNKPLYHDAMLQLLLHIGINLKTVSGNEFYEAVKSAANNPQTLFISDSLVNDMDSHGRLIYDSNIHIKNDFSCQFMSKIGFEWTDIDESYIKSYIDYFKELGYFK